MPKNETARLGGGGYTPVQSNESLLQSVRRANQGHNEESAQKKLIKVMRLTAHTCTHTHAHTLTYTHVCAHTRVTHTPNTRTHLVTAEQELLDVGQELL